MKHFLKTFAALLAASSLLVFFASCQTDDDDDSSDSGTVAVTSVELNKTTTSITVGETETLTATVKPDNATDKTVTWSSSDTTVATVENGVITAVASGDATITAKAGDKTATCAVTVTVPKIVDLSTLTEDTTVADGYTITGTLSVAVQVSIADGATVTLSGASINADSGFDSSEVTGFPALACLGDATISIADGTENTLYGIHNPYTGGGAGIFVPSGSTVTVTGNGALTVQGATGAAGIGCNRNDDGGDIVIEGGIITASSRQGAGIGGGYKDCGTITITGGTITATAGGYNAAIGSGGGHKCGNITISGGTITATGGGNSAGIGGGTLQEVSNGGSSWTKVPSECGTITITSDVTSVTAVKGGSLAPYSIGAGYQSTCGTVTIGGTEGAITESPYTYDPNAPKAPTGGIDGLFSVSETKQVYFSKGNLQASLDSTQASIEWKFADHQYDFIGINPGNTNIVTGTTGGVTSDTAVTVDLFGWVGESSEFTNAAAFGIVSSTTNEDYGNTSSEALKNDWGSNAITNGGNDASYGWRTLTYDEWNYVVKTRTDADSKKGAATVNNIKGWILLPDDWTLPDGACFTSGFASEYTTNSYTADEWVVMENAGAVFLPAAGDRLGTALPMSFCANQGYYWTATSSGTQSALCANFDSDSFSNGSYWSKYFGMAVRLAKDSE
ncbi:MAG: Ig-like domain-containing protein [Treponema sp.]|nr:Ig-like domain-containing protein [Treponema sp.]